MKQLGNLAIVCANRQDVRMELCRGSVTVHVGSKPIKTALCARWDDDHQILRIIYELNFGKYAGKRSA